MITRFAPTLMTLTVAGSLLAGCGAVPGSTSGLAAQSVGGKSVVKLGFGAEGGDAPALVKRANGEWLMVYVGTNVADRHLYWTTSPDGSRWSAPRAIEAAAYSEQAPALTEDANGVVHLFFASNRDGEDFELFHATFNAGTWTASEAVSGYTGVQDLAIAYANGRFLLAAEVMGVGLEAATSADGKTFSAPETLADAGFDPAAAFLPDGKAVVAFTRGDDLVSRAGTTGHWAAEQIVTSTTGRLRGPALTWAGDHGELVYAERSGATGTAYALKNRRFDAALKFTEAKPLAAFGGDANSPAMASDHNGKIGLAWGMKLSSSQQGVAFTLDGWK